MNTSTISASSVSLSDLASLLVDGETLRVLAAALESTSESASAVMYGCDASDPS